jgi:DNA-binding GntR family transcriptional regulator
MRHVAPFTSKSDFRPPDIADTNLRGAVLQHLRTEIVSGKTGPGTIFSAPSLAKTLGISTTPVREALLELAGSGLVEPMKNRGFRVLHASASDLKDLATLRAQLEVMAVRTICMGQPVSCDTLEALASAVGEAVSERHATRYIAADRAFHLELISLANNRYLTEMAMHLRDNMRIYGLESDAGFALQYESVKEHFQIIDALRTQDTDEASRLMRAHVLAWVPVVSSGASALVQAAKGRQDTLGDDQAIDVADHPFVD